MKTIAIVIALAGFTGAVAAQAEGPVNARQLNQERRIDAGVRSGKLTHAEAARLKRQQAAIRQDAAYRRGSHGKLTAHDKQMIHARQDAANARILKQKNDRERGPNKLPFK